MATGEFDIDSLDFSIEPSASYSLGNSEGGASQDPGTPFQEPGYEGSIDYRIRQLSYSSLLTLHSCPRKFQLYRLRTTHKSPESEKSNITFAFGHVVGDGIQKILQGLSQEQVIWEMFLGWHADLLAEDPKGSKSFWEACLAIRKFIALQEAGFLDEYELAYFQGKPACELSFRITFPGGFQYRGHVDAVLRHKVSKVLMVLELKTTGMTNINPAQYKNSAQAIGYSIILDHIDPELSSYEVLYLIYHTKSREYNPIPFTKNYLQRALWIREVLLDIETIQMYDQAGVYPMHGESCISFGRDCEYLNTCTLSTQYLTKPATKKDLDPVTYDLELTLQDLLETQLGKIS